MRRTSKRRSVKAEFLEARLAPGSAALAATGHAAEVGPVSAPESTQFVLRVHTDHRFYHQGQVVKIAVRRINLGPGEGLGGPDAARDFEVTITRRGVVVWRLSDSDKPPPGQVRVTLPLSILIPPGQSENEHIAWNGQYTAQGMLATSGPFVAHVTWAGQTASSRPFFVAGLR